MRILRESSEDEMIACFLHGELTSRRFGPGLRAALTEAGLSERLLAEADLGDENENRARRDLLGAARGYGQNRDVFDEDFPAPASVHWIRAELSQAELALVRYIDYSYWNELSGGTRLPADAARRIREGVRVFGVSNQRFAVAARAVARGERFPPLILAGRRLDDLVCLEGHLRLTGYALAGFPVEVECLVGTAPTMGRWAR
jgi:hypothetical protein